MTYIYTLDDLGNIEEIAHEADARQEAYHAGWLNAQDPAAPVAEVDDSPYPEDWVDGFCDYLSAVLG